MDYWREAIQEGADFIHLGQEDLADADLAAIRAARVKLGISTHSDEELGIALAAEPDYVALGPIYPTLLKKMPWAPQGSNALRPGNPVSPALSSPSAELRRTGRPASQAGADSVAVITDIDERAPRAADPNLDGGHRPTAGPDRRPCQR